ncbi:hypothetical protein FJT64_027124 [Amphibalanus amphitrite]|uniref:Uncharacterized protein n=1 Tax=Amphibalanus amphitrite TaxID=1232801 RepID=A0A6A4W9P5_AMPAM|nr:hypothetical protein FJT64_027124 [Amphibalanus amphitrite]
MLKGFWLCLKRFPKPELVVFACVAVLVIAFGKAIDKYVKGKVVEVYAQTNSISRENLEIVLCPMPRVYGLRMTHFGESLPKFFNKLLYDDLITPFMDDLEVELRKEYPHAFTRALKDGILKCLENEREFKPTDPLPLLISKMANFGRCQVRRPFFMPLYLALEDGTMIKRFLDKYFGTLEEMLLEEYPGLLDQAWVLPYDNMTIEQMLNYVGVNLKRYIDEDLLRKSMQDIAGPTQTLEESLIDTRMAPNCFRHLFRHNENQGYQRSKITYQFRKSCPKEPEKTLIGKSPCLETSDMYITVYITAYNQFTDVPAASVIVPYRVAADENTLVHVSAVKRIHTKHCKDYGEEESQVTCIESCLYEKMTSENKTEGDDTPSEGKMRCRVPWIDRLKRRSNLHAVDLPLCHTKQELKSTIETIRTVFDLTEASNCTKRCPRHCDQLTITPRLAGSAHTPQNGSARTARHPRLEVLISDELLVFGEAQQYDFGKMVAEMLGNLSFLVGVSLVALYDWLIGLALWMFGKLPFIPSMPPLIKSEIYMSEACSCAETEEERRHSLEDTMDESATFLAASFRHHRRGSVLRSFNPHDDTSRRRRAMTINQLPTIALRTSAMDTLARTFPPEEKSEDHVRTSTSSVARSRSVVNEAGSSGVVAGEGSGTVGPPKEEVTPVRSRGSVLPSLAPPSEPKQPAAKEPSLEPKGAVETEQTKPVEVPEARPSRSVLKKTSSRRVAPAEDVSAPREPSREHLPSLPAAAPAGGGLPSIGAPRQAHPRGTVTFDLDEVEDALGTSESEVRPAPESAPAPQRRHRPFRRRTQGSTAPTEGQSPQ